MLKRLFNYSQMMKMHKAVKETPFRELYPALQITNGCNKQCRGCLRSANSYTYKMSHEQFEKYLEDLRRLGESSLLKYQFVTGGEPTIWKSGDMDIVDALISLFELNLIEIISMPTNGKNFEDLNYTREFFKRLSSRINRKAVVGISISGYQGNLGESGYIAMDNLLSISREPGIKLHPVVLATMSADDDIDVRLKKIYPGVQMRVVPLAPLGDAEGMEEMCPSMSISGKDKSRLGSFRPHFRKEIFEKLKIPESDFESFPNYALINLLSQYAHCGDSPFVDDRWHYCLPLKDDPRYDLCAVGEMLEGTIPDFLEETKFLNCIRAEGILSAVDEHKDELSDEAKDKLEYLYTPGTRLSVAYRGCMVCKKMYDYGIIKELNDGHSSGKR